MLRHRAEFMDLPDRAGVRGTTGNWIRQVFWLMAHLDPRSPSQGGLPSPVASSPRAWPITAAAPRRIHTVFPILPTPRFEPGSGTWSFKNFRATGCSWQGGRGVARRPRVYTAIAIRTSKVTTPTRGRCRTGRKAQLKSSYNLLPFHSLRIDVSKSLHDTPPLARTLPLVNTSRSKHDPTPRRQRKEFCHATTDPGPCAVASDVGGSQHRSRDARRERCRRALCDLSYRADAAGHRIVPEDLR